ncbi:MAG: hypothetical protein IPN52_01090 [Micrococcales bacterium]|nr:hypothetical protein [Micrococcales bacterium]
MARNRTPYRALLVGGVDPDDMPDGAALVAGSSRSLVVALEPAHNDATRAADVVFPVAVVTEKAGSFVDWEGRRRPFPQVFRESLIPDRRAVLAAIGDEMLTRPQDEPIALGRWRKPARGLRRPAAEPARLAPGEAVLVTWHQLLDDGSMQAGEPYMAATARPPVVRVSPANASDLGISDGDPVTVTGDIGSLTLPALVTDMPSGIVWVPMNSGTNVVSALGVASGDTVRVSVGRVS